MIDPILCMLPYWSSPLIVGRPAWLTPIPEIYKLRARLAITLDRVEWRDRYGMVWPTLPGLPTDGKSSPIDDRWARETLRPAVTHDNRYLLHKLVRLYFDTRERADESLKDGLLLDDPREARRDLFFVRLCGQAVYDYGETTKMDLDWLDAVAHGPDALAAWIEAIKSGKSVYQATI